MGYLARYVPFRFQALLPTRGTFTLACGGAADATDPGGRLGPNVGRGEPDLRNLRL